MTTASTDIPRGRRRAGTALIAVMAVVAASEWHVVFGWRPTAPLIALAVVAAAAPMATGSPRRPLAITGGLSVAVLVGVLAALAGDATPGRLLDGLVHGWSRILSTTLQVPAAEGRILPPAGVAWLAGFVGAECALRLRRRPAVAVVAPLAAYAVALPFGAGGGSLLSAVALVVVGLAAVRVLSPPTPTEAPLPAGAHSKRSRPRRAWPQQVSRLAGTAVLAGASAGLGLLVGGRLPLGDSNTPYDPRADQRPPLNDAATIDPLSLLAGWALDRDDPVLFSVDGPVTDRWRLAVLDRYDPGTGWSSKDSYVAAGSRVPPPEVPDTTATSGPDVERTVTIDRLEGLWLPTTGRPAGLAGIEAYVDRATSMLVHGDGLSSGMRYRLTSSPGRVSDDCSSSGRPVAPPPTGGDPWLTGELVTYATAVTRGAASQCTQAELIEAYLRSDHFAFSPDVPSGATLARTIELLQPGDGPKAGTSEQFATAFALLARASGMDVRVAVGFRGGVRVGDVHRVRASDAYAWAEVRFGSLGWVSFDPTPGSGEDDPQIEAPAPPVTPAPTTPEPATTTPTSTTPTTVSTTVTTDIGGGGGGPESGPSLVLVAGAGGGALVVVAAAAISTVRRRRRAARRRPAAAVERVVGAWRQCLVELRDGGLPMVQANSASDYVDQARGALGPRFADDLRDVAVLANQALFGGRASDEDAARAWRSADRLAKRLADERSQADRVRYALDVRALVHS